MVKEPIEIKLKLEESARHFLGEIEYSAMRYEEWQYYHNNPYMIWINKSNCSLRHYYNLNNEFRDILHAVKDVIADVYKSIYFVVEYFAYKHGGKQKTDSIVKTGIKAMTQHQMIQYDDSNMIGKMAGCRNRISHDVNYTLTYALNNRYNIHQLLINMIGIIELECSNKELEKFDFEQRYLEFQNKFIEELGDCLNDLVSFDSIAG